MQKKWHLNAPEWDEYESWVLFTHQIACITRNAAIQYRYGSNLWPYQENLLFVQVTAINCLAVAVYGMVDSPTEGGVVEIASLVASVRLS